MTSMASQTDFQKLTAGQDLDKFEGPLGESLLPGASIGYERVVAKNIYSGSSSNGFTVYEFYTAKDYPSMQMNVTPIDNSKSQFIYIPAIIVNYNTDNRWAAQGYSFVTNDMHGKSKSVTSYGGQYIVGQDENMYKLYTQESYEYFPVGSPVPVLNANGTITQQTIGRDEEVTIEGRTADDVSLNASVEFNSSVGFFFEIVIPEFFGMPYLSSVERKATLNTNSRVIHYPSILFRTTSKMDGVTHIEENRLFDYMTGMPIATVSNDEYYQVNSDNSNLTGTYTSYDIPAHYIYGDLGGKYHNQKYSLPITVNSNTNTSVTFTTANQNILNVGDLLKIGGSYANVDVINGNTVVALLNPYLPVDPNLGSATGAMVIGSSFLNSFSLSAGDVVIYGQDQLYNPQAPAPAYPNFPTYALVNSPLNNGVSINGLPNVVSASANVFTRQWTIPAGVKSDYNVPGTDNKYITGEYSNMRLLTNYVYRSPVKNSSDPSVNKVYNGGFIAGNISPFNYMSLPSSTDPNWIQGNTVNFYSPNGDPLEEVNVLGIPYAAKFTLNSNVVALTVANGKYASVLFDGFEDKSGLNISTANIYNAHSGYNSYQLQPNATYNQSGSPRTITVDSRVMDGLSVRFWAKGEVSSINNLVVGLSDVTSSANVLGTLALIARTGEWTLYEAQFYNFAGINSGDQVYPYITNNDVITVFLDDIRVQPLESKMNCFVYDNTTYRLLASFDDQHFGLYYQYNAEGKLVRKLAETERGTKTITETLYNTPLKARQ
jgi:YD repeat-containing protein